MNQPILQLDRCIDEQLGIADPASSENVRALRSSAELEQIVEALVVDAESLPVFSNRQAIRSRVLAQVTVTAAPRPSMRRPALRRSRLVALGAACALLSTTTAAFAGMLPGPVQKLVARAAQQVGVDLPVPVRDAPPAKRSTETASLMSPPPPAEVSEPIEQSRDLTPRTSVPAPTGPRPVTPPATRSQATDPREVEDRDAPETEKSDAVEVEIEQPEQPEQPEPAEPAEPEVPKVQEAPEPEADGDD